MRYYVVTEEELLDGIKPKEAARVWQWYGEEELSTDLQSGKINIHDESGNLIPEEDVLKFAKSIEGTMSTSEISWDNLALDMQYEIEYELNEKIKE